MNTVKKESLSKEAEMQINALKKIRTWKTISIAVSTIGVAAAYAGFAGQNRYLFLGILGIVLIVLGIICAGVLNLGLKNGRRNVEKILNVLEGKAMPEGKAYEV